MKNIKLLLCLFVVISFGCLAFIVSGIYGYFKLGLSISELLIGLSLFGSGLFMCVIMCLEYWQALKSNRNVDYKNFAKNYKIPISIITFVLGVSIFLVGHTLVKDIGGKIFSYAGAIFFCYGALNLALGKKK